ncbi:MAG: MATE family efflux transporter [Spirochaetaceae bacterium]|nr:MATE family efflux transporter [Spirochaetaceae bacterium]
MIQREGTVNLTEGTPIKQIIRFMLPLVLGDSFQLLYQLADSVIVGRSLGSSALAALGCSASFQALVFSFGIYLTGGFSVILAQRVGAGDREAVQNSFSACIRLSLIASLAITVALLVLTKPILVLLRIAPEIFDDAYRYVLILFCGSPFVFLYNMLSNALRSCGDSRSPLFFLIICSVTNIVLDYLCVVLMQAGVAGAAWATVFSQALSVLLCALFIRRYCVASKLFAPLPSGEIRAHLVCGIAQGLQHVYVEIGNILVQATANGLGTTVIGAVAAAQRIRGLNMLPLFCMSRAVSFYTAQNYGAGKRERIYPGIRATCLITVLTSGIMGFINYALGDRLLALLLVNAPEAVALAHTYLKFTGATLFLLGFMLIFLNAVQGCGGTKAPLLCGIGEMLMSIITAFVLIPRLGFLGLCVANPLAWFVSLLPVYVAFTRSAARKLC